MSNNNPTVSTIIPTYNRAHLIGRAIQSVLNQTYQNFEIIVVDDCSTDNTWEVIKEFIESEKRIQYFKHNENKGGSAARNTGIKMAKGDYIAFLDSDDEWLPGKLEKQLKIFKNNSVQVGAIYSGFQYIYQKGIDMDKRHIPKNRGYIYKDLLMKNCVGSASTLLIKKECFDKVKLFDKSLPSCQDYDMWIRIAKYYEFDFVKESLVKYQVHDNQISTNLSTVIKGEKKIINKYLKELKKSPIIYSEHCFFLGNKLCHAAEMREGRKYLFKAIIIYPFCMKYHIYVFSSLFGARFYKLCYKVKKLLLVKSLFHE
jgi:glycosyltransferase involved in cell wall biosynthesis